MGKLVTQDIDPSWYINRSLATGAERVAFREFMPRHQCVVHAKKLVTPEVPPKSYRRWVSDQSASSTQARPAFSLKAKFPYSKCPLTGLGLNPGVDELRHAREGGTEVLPASIFPSS